MNGIEIIFVVLAGIGGTLMIIYWGIKHEEAKLRISSGHAASDTVNQSLQQEVAGLRDRVAVLEKLVTDDDRRLASDIERLRRTPAQTQA